MATSTDRFDARVLADFLGMFGRNGRRGLNDLSLGPLGTAPEQREDSFFSARGHSPCVSGVGLLTRNVGQVRVCEVAETPSDAANA
jgi:hypothetical protein